MKTIIINQARMSSSRLPGKVLKQVLNKSLLEYQIERLKKVKLADEIVVATTELAVDDPIINLCKKLAVKFFRGSENDVLSRYHAAAVEHEAKLIVRITSDCPLIDPQVIDDVIQAYVSVYPKYDYISNCQERTFPRGMDVEIFSFLALNEAYLEADKIFDREHVTLFIHKQPQRYKIGQVKFNQNLSENRWTVDTHEDYELIKKIIEYLYPLNPNFSMIDVLDLLSKNPQWRLINSHVEQKEE